MHLYEQQSTVNPNMPLRGLFYFAKLYQREIEKRDSDIYGSTLVKISAPQFIVFYNGNAEQDDIVKYRLSDSFEIADGSGEFEWTATVININKNHNESLQKKCKSLYHYCAFVNRVKENLKKKIPANEAIDEAVDFAISGNFLDGFFREQRGYILGDLLTEFDQEAYDRHRRREGFVEGVRTNAIENARNLLQKSSLSPDMIAECCSLPLEKVLALKDEFCVHS